MAYIHTIHIKWFLSPAERPELYQLQRLESRGGRPIEVIEKVAAHWERLALALHFEGHVLEIVKRDEMTVEGSCRSILYRWLNGEARTPVSWDTLITSLKEIKFRVLAEDLELALKT